MKTIQLRKSRRARPVAAPLTVFIALVSFWSFLYAMASGWNKGEKGRSDPKLANRVLGSVGQSVVDIDRGPRPIMRSPGYQESFVCPYCRSSYIQPSSKRTCEQRIDRLMRQNNGLGAIGAKLSYLEAAIAVAARKDLACQRCDPAACSDQDKRFYHKDEVGPKILHAVSPIVQVEDDKSRAGPYGPRFSQMTLVNPSCASIPDGLAGNDAAFLCLFSLIDRSCKRDQRSSKNATHYLGVSVLDATLSSIGKDGVFEATSEWTIVTDQQGVLYLASASIQIPLVIADHFDKSLPSVMKFITASPNGTVSLNAIESLSLERHHRVNSQQLATIVPSFGTSDELGEDDDSAAKMGTTPIAIACCAEVTRDEQKLFLGVAGYRQASSIFVMNSANKVVALTGKFCFTPDCDSHRIHSISSHKGDKLLVAYEERCSSMLLVLDTVDVLCMLFSPHKRLLD